MGMGMGMGMEDETKDSRVKRFKNIFQSLCIKLYLLAKSRILNYQSLRGVYILMGKTSLKTFVCSFVLSLFTILSVNKEFFGVSKPSDAEIKIPNKNISLFFKDMPAKTVANKTIPIKKIALTVPLPLAEEPAAVESQEDLIPLTFAENTAKPSLPSTLQAEVLPPPPLPENISAPIIEPEEAAKAAPPEKQEEIAEEKDLFSPFSSKVVQATVQIIRPNEKKIAQRLKKSTSAEAEAVVAQAEIPLEKSQQETRAPADDALTQNVAAAEEEPNLLAKAPEEEFRLLAAVPDAELTQEDDTPAENDGILPPTFKVAQAAANPDTVPAIVRPKKPQSEPENLLIPLQKDSNVPLQTAEARVTETPDKDKLAMLTNKASIRSMEKSVSTEQPDDTTSSGWQTMAEKNDENSSWIAAKGAGHQHNRQTVKEKYFQNAESKQIKEVLDARRQENNLQDTKLASQVVKNLLIPIPEEILNDPNLTPQLVASEQDKEIEQQLIEQENLHSEKQTLLPKQQVQDTSKTQDKGLLKSITSIFSKDENKQVSDDDTSTPNGSFIDKFISKGKKKSTQDKILPTEIRLAFQPNRAEISGVTLKWLQAFANKTIEDSSAGLEIRIDGGSSYQLQQKRLNLLHNILTNNGVNYRKIKTVFTTREPNSFIIRTIRLNNDTNGGIKEDNEWQDYYKAW